MTVSSKGLVLVNPREEGGGGGQETDKPERVSPVGQVLILQTLKSLGSTLSWSICHHTLLNTLIFFPKRTYPFKVPFSSSLEYSKLNSGM